jgi:hypothetical protein
MHERVKARLRLAYLPQGGSEQRIWVRGVPSGVHIINNKKLK